MKQGLRMENGLAYGSVPPEVSWQETVKSPQNLGETLFRAHKVLTRGKAAA